MTDIDVVESRMGDYGDPVARMHKVETIYAVLRSGGKFPPGLDHPVRMIIDKLTRAAVSPELEDNWTDIIGYADIALRVLRSQEKEEK